MESSRRDFVNRLLAERERIDEEGGGVVAVRTPSPSQISTTLSSRITAGSSGWFGRVSASSAAHGSPHNCWLRDFRDDDMNAQKTFIASLFAVEA
jgi:hypothetical protein